MFAIIVCNRKKDERTMNAKTNDAKRTTRKTTKTKSNVIVVIFEKNSISNANEIRREFNSQKTARAFIRRMISKGHMNDFVKNFETNEWTYKRATTKRATRKSKIATNATTNDATTNE